MAKQPLIFLDSRIAHLRDEIVAGAMIPVPKVSMLCFAQQGYSAQEVAARAARVMNHPDTAKQMRDRAINLLLLGVPV